MNGPSFVGLILILAAIPATYYVTRTDKEP